MREARSPQEQLPRKRRLAMLARTLAGMARPAVAAHLSGADAAHLPPMRGRVEVLRDANAVVHIYAEHERDLYAALGYAQGADRFVLLDVIRHFGAGRLCELIGNFTAPKSNEMFPGKSVADIDAFVRPLEFEAQSARDFDRMSRPRAATASKRSPTGVNAALRAMHGTLSRRSICCLGPVRPWRPSDALLAAQTCAFTVALSPLDVELTFDAIRGHLRDDGGEALLPGSAVGGRADELCGRGRAGARAADPSVRRRQQQLGGERGALGIGGADRRQRSARAVPAAADVLVPRPSRVPALSRARRLDARLSDLRLRPQRRPRLGRDHRLPRRLGPVSRASPAGRSVALPHRRRQRRDHQASRERIACASGASAPLEWERCEHGIIYPGWKHHDGVDLAVRYVGSDLARYFEGYLALAEATTVDEHQRALALINEGPFDFNHVYGHKDGHIAWEPFGRLPRRRADGLFVRDAHDPAAQWDGFLPFARIRRSSTRRAATSPRPTR